MQDRNRGMSGNATTSQSASTTSGEVKEQVQQKAADVKEQVQQTAADVKEQVAAQATDKLAGQKDAASGSLNTVAHAFRQTSEQLRDNDQAGIADYVERAAGQVEHFAGYLNRRDIRGLTHDTEQFARREPALFLGGAFALGIFAARFLKSSGSGSQGGGQGNQKNRQGQNEWQGQRSSPQAAARPQLPPPATPAASAVAGRPASVASSAGLASAASGLGTAQGRTMPSTSTLSTTNAGRSPQAAPPKSDVTVGGPPRDSGRGGR